MNSKNIDELIEEAWAIEREDAREAGAIGYMARALTIATMPHKKSTDYFFKRRNGNFCLTMLSDPDVGLPYGSLPRLLIAWLTTEVQRTKEKRLVLGPSLGGFMRELGLTPSAGRWGTKSRLREQMRRLFMCCVRGTWSDETRDVGRSYLIADDYELWWDPQSEDQAALWQSSVTVGQRFFEEIRDHPVPIDLRVLEQIKRSPMAIDIYCWMTHRMSYLRKDIKIPWSGLQAQFGAGYATHQHGRRDFKRAFLRELKKVSLFYGEANVDFAEDALLLKPSRTHVPPALPPAGGE